MPYAPGVYVYNWHMCEKCLTTTRETELVKTAKGWECKDSVRCARFWRMQVEASTKKDGQA
jgi:hypothetical protein